MNIILLYILSMMVGGCCYSNLSVKFLLWVYVPGYSVDYSGLLSCHRNVYSL